MKIFHNKKFRQKIPSVEIIMLGESTPEDANEFYIPFCESLADFCNPQIGNSINFTFNFKLCYYNTASTRYITRILTILKPLFEKKTVTINWYHLNIDEGMKELGEDLAETMKMKFNIIEI